MEHRWSTRIPLSNRITLYQNNEPIAEGIAKDIGRGGLFLESGPLRHVINTTVSVVLTMDTEEGLERFCLLACVIHSSNTGVGLMFLEDNNNFSYHIRQLILNSVSAYDQAQDIANYSFRTKQ